MTTQSMPSPLQLFNDPGKYWDLVVAARAEEFESQHFDRKEVRVDSNSQVRAARDGIIETISAFANSNRDGGVLILGVSNIGTVKGVRHVDEQTLNGILKALEHLRNHATQTANHACINAEGKEDLVILLYVPWCPNAICETVEGFPKAWKRVGRQCLPLTDHDREQLKRDKHIVDFEVRHCAQFNLTDIDKDVLEEFTKWFVEGRGTLYPHPPSEILHSCGAITRSQESFSLTQAGNIFFSSNPRALNAGAFLRFLRYDSTEQEWDKVGLPTFDREFDGPLPSLVRKVRMFLKESAYFKHYSHRNPDGGFTDEPEYPFNTVDEAIVNSLIHRDYAVSSPIKCVALKDAFVVISPGNVPQNVPKEFSLDAVTLESVLRNPKIVEWMRVMKDERGSPFVRALREGTKTMLLEMGKSGLKAPFYKTEINTVVVLYNNAEERERALLQAYAPDTQEFTNLFKLLLNNGNSEGVDRRDLKRGVTEGLKDLLLNKGWFVDKFSFGRVVAHIRGSSLPLPEEVNRILQIFPAYAFQVRDYGNELYLNIDYKAELKSVLPLNRLLGIELPTFIGRVATVRYADHWLRARIVEVGSETSKVQALDLMETFDIPNGQIIPELPKNTLKIVLRAFEVRYDFDQKLKEYSLASVPNAARVRAEKTCKIAAVLLRDVLPLNIENVKVSIAADPLRLRLPKPGGSVRTAEPLTVFHDIREPAVEFYKSHDDVNILEGLTKFGSFEKGPKDIELIPMCTFERKQQMESLIERLRKGKFKYHGAERTFGVLLKYQSVVSTGSVDDFQRECQRLLRETEKWGTEERLRHLFLIFLPEDRYPITDLSSPYFALKELLFAHGIPVQMVDSPTLDNPDFKDLNLALNIVAKCGGVPWVLPDELPDVDFFIGLSYTQNIGKDKSKRQMGFANVFNNYGRWKFYHGSAQSFDYNDRLKYYRELVRTTMERMNLGQTPSVHFHYSAKFSREDRTAILESARAVRPKGRFTFVWINTTHMVKLYDGSAQSDGSLGRGAYVVTSPKQFFLSTTGYNLYRKAMGTPIPLEVNLWFEPKEIMQTSDLRVIAKQLMYLTKLNWASTQSICGEPITIKYAGDIARLTSAFLERSGEFKLHPALESTPWFI